MQCIPKLQIGCVTEADYLIVPLTQLVSLLLLILGGYELVRGDYWSCMGVVGCSKRIHVLCLVSLRHILVQDILLRHGIQVVLL